MPFREHPVFEQPDDEDHVVWRYLDSTQFISALQNRGLWFTRTDRFEDPFEGIFPEERFLEEYERQLVNERIEELVLENLPNVVPVASAKAWREEHQFGIQEVFRKMTYMNCWHMNDYESLAMWHSNISAGDGVLIKSTYDKLKSAVDIHGDYVYRMGVVDYVPYFEDGIEDQMEDRVRMNYLYPLMKKQIEYEHEREVRVVISGNESNIDNETGFAVKTDLRNLIDQVIISPTAPAWITPDFWRNICRKYRIYPDISTSDLEITPDQIVSDAEKAIAERVDERVQEWKDEQEWLE